MEKLPALNMTQCQQVGDCFNQFLEKKEILELWDGDIISASIEHTETGRQQYKIQCLKDCALEKYFTARGIEGFVAEVDDIEDTFFVRVIFIK